MRERPGPTAEPEQTDKRQGKGCDSIDQSLNRVGITFASIGKGIEGCSSEGGAWSHGARSCPLHPATAVPPPY